MTDSPILNPQALQALRDLSSDGGEDFLRELVTIFLEDTPRQLAELEDALARQDAIKATQAAHSIKGSSSNFGATEFARLALTIEMHGKANDLSATAAALPGFKAEFARVSAALQKLTGGA